MELPADDGRIIHHIRIDGPWDPRDDWNLSFRLDIMEDLSDSNSSDNSRQHAPMINQNIEVISISSSSLEESLFHEENIFDASTKEQTEEDDDEVSDLASDDGFLCQFCGEPSGCDCVERGYKM